MAKRLSNEILYPSTSLKTIHLVNNLIIYDPNKSYFTFNVNVKSSTVGKYLVGTVTLTSGYSATVQVNSGLSSVTKNL